MLKKMIAMSLLTVAMGGLGVACGGGEEGGDACSSDGDCKGDRICEGGECVNPGGGNNDSNNDSNTSSNSPNNGPTSNAPNNGPTSNAPNNTPNNGPTSNAPNNTPNNDSGSIGSECSTGSDCDSEYCRVPAGGFDGQCAVNDFGQMCEGNADCEYGACLFEDPDVDIFGYCTSQCESFTDCPTFWDCDEVGNASGTYCIQD